MTGQVAAGSEGRPAAPSSADGGEESSQDAWLGAVRDEAVEIPVVHRTRVFDGKVWNLCRDEIAVHGQTVERDWIEHTGAVGVIALDDDDRVLLIRQYRHPVAMMMFEPPAGLMDSAGESGVETARRELAEEAGLQASEWALLAEFCNSPGGSSEAFRCFLARGITEIPGGRVITGEAEELHLPCVWVPLSEAVELVRAGAVQNPATVVGILAASDAARSGFAGLRSADSPWPMRDHLDQAGRLRAGD